MVDSSIVADKKKAIYYYQQHLQLVIKHKPMAISLQQSLISNLNNQIPSLITKQNRPPIKNITIDSLYGILQLSGGKYIAAVTKSVCPGQIFNRKIYKVERIQFFQIVKNGYKIVPPNSDYNTLKSISSLLNNKCFYFSDDYDLTKSLQNFIDSNNEMNNKNSDYFWNQCWLDQIIKLKANDWVTGFIQGYVQPNFCHLSSGFNCQFSIISRKNKIRDGLRFISRGSDNMGNASNTVQTEQILHLSKKNVENYYSAVQLRGSMPFKWSQKPDMKVQPSVLIQKNDEQNKDIFKKHIDKFLKNYEGITIINLVDKKNSKTQLKIGTYFTELINKAKIENVNYVWFDFHYQCRNMKYQNLAKLLDKIKKQISSYGFFAYTLSKQKSTKIKSQRGIFRTNCMDCLDRTNVVQSVIARTYLHNMLFQVAAVQKSQHIQPFQKLPDQLEQNFKKMWSQNADILSLLYAGTPALKTDFTKTGNRTIKGALKDLFFSIKRYYINIFSDPYCQDLLLKKINPRQKIDQRKYFSSFVFLVLMFMMLPIGVHYLFEKYSMQYVPQGINMQSEVLVQIVAILSLFKMLPIIKYLFVKKTILNDQ